MLRYILRYVESENKELIIEIFTSAVHEQDEGKIMSIANEFIQEGLEQGMQQERMIVAKSLLARDISLDVISKATRMSLEEIKKLKMKVH
jgi:hypothetical protein